MPTRKVSDDLSREAFGLTASRRWKSALNSLHQVVVAAAVEQLGDQRAFGFSVLREVDRQLHQVRDARASADAMPDRLGAMSDTTTSALRPPCTLEFGQHAVSRKVACRKITPSIGSIGRMSSAMMVPSSSPAAAPPGRHPAPRVLAPGTRRRAEVDHQLARLDQPERLVDLLELVGGACAIPSLVASLT
jgi:hypothetical protein